MLSIKSFTCIKLSKSSHTSQNMVYEALKNGIIFLSFFHVLMKCGFIWQYRHFKDAVPAFNAEITEFPSKFLKEKRPLQIWSWSLLILNPSFFYQWFLMILLGLVCTTKVTLGERCWPLVEGWFFFFGNRTSAVIYLFEGQTLFHWSVCFASVSLFAQRGFTRRMMFIHVTIFFFLHFISTPGCYNIDLAFQLGCWTTPWASSKTV